MIFWKMDVDAYRQWMPAVRPDQVEKCKRPYSSSRFFPVYVIESPLDFEVGDKPVEVFIPYRGGTDMNSITLCLIIGNTGDVQVYTMGDAIDMRPFSVKVKEEGFYGEGCILGHIIILENCIGHSSFEPDYDKEDTTLLAQKHFLDWR